MRIKRSRLETYYHRKREVKKDSEGSTREQYGAAVSFCGESWPAGGKVQAEQYGQRLSYIRNLRIDGKYTMQTDENGMVHYILENGADIMELDGVCIFVEKEQRPDYRIISMKPYRFLTLEVERI